MTIDEETAERILAVACALPGWQEAAGVNMHIVTDPTVALKEGMGMALPVIVFSKPDGEILLTLSLHVAVMVASDIGKIWLGVNGISEPTGHSQMTVGHSQMVGSSGTTFKH